MTITAFACKVITIRDRTIIKANRDISLSNISRHLNRSPANSTKNLYVMSRDYQVMMKSKDQKAVRK
jgi:hypothetical protein